MPAGAHPAGFVLNLRRASNWPFRLGVFDVMNRRNRTEQVVRSDAFALYEAGEFELRSPCGRRSIRRARTMRETETRYRDLSTTWW